MKRGKIVRGKGNGGVRGIGNRTEALQVPVVDLVAAAQEGMHGRAERLGMELMERSIDVERAILTESPERIGNKWGSQPGYAFWNGRKIPLGNKRVRTLDGEEGRLQSYGKVQEDGAKGRLAMRDMMRGVATRNYREGAEGFLRGYGMEKSSVSRQFIRASERKLREMMERDISGLDLS